MSKEIIKRTVKKSKKSQKIKNESEEPIITNEDEEIDTKINDLTSINFNDFDSDIKYEQIAKNLLKDLFECKQKIKKSISQIRKLEAQHENSLKKAKKQKSRRRGNTKPTGFIKKSEIKGKLAKYIKVEKDVQLSGPELTKEIWKQLSERGLQYSKDKRVFRTDDETEDVFGVPKSVNKITSHKDPNGFNFCNIQKYISYALTNSNS